MKQTMMELKELLEDDFELLVEAFDLDNRKHFNDLSEWIIKGHYKEVAIAAHSVKGASSNLGAVRLSELCQQLETQANNGILQDALELLQQIRDEFELVINVLKSC